MMLTLSIVEEVYAEKTFDERFFEKLHTLHNAIVNKLEVNQTKVSEAIESAKKLNDAQVEAEAKIEQRL